VKIRPQIYDFEFEPVWFRDSAWQTYFWNAHSILFEHTEKTYIDTLKKLQQHASVDPQLAADIAVTVAQEHWHRHNHVNFNRVLAQHYDCHALHRAAKRICLGIRHLDMANQLSFCYCFESITVWVARFYLWSMPKNVSSPELEFWRWHAQEEIEHGFVAAAVQQQHPVGMWRRCSNMFMSLRYYASFIASAMWLQHTQRGNK
jgi:predicted metal-dependent hydrolase